jgi:hypothetical protein
MVNGLNLGQFTPKTFLITNIGDQQKMRLLDEDNDKSINRVSIYLTKSEANELYCDLKRIMETPINNHAHVPSEDYKKEITVCIYSEEAVDEGFNERSKRLIKKDE